jgi:predicted Zn-dependent protease
MKKLLNYTILLVFILGCTKVPISNRKQLNLLPEGTLLEMSYSQYGKFLSEKPPLPLSDPRAALVKKVGDNIAVAAELYLKKNKQTHRVKGFQWEFNTVDDNTVNAWCMPGGKVVFYTGIIDVCQDETGIAVVMGHEVAHAIARHGNERMSQQMALQMGGLTIAAAMQEKPEFTQNIFLASYGVGSTLGALKFSRTHESEADKMGLIFMAKAGYDPNKAVDFWERMAALGGGAPPEFLSTHPSHETRVSELKKFMPEALKYYNPK